MRSEESIRSLLEKVLSLTRAPSAQAEYLVRNTKATRFGENAITQNTAGEVEQLRLKTAFGNRQGSSMTNRLDDTSLKALAERAESIASDSPPDPEYMPPLGPQVYPAVPRRAFDDVLALTPDDLADRVRICVDLAAGHSFSASGLFVVEESARALATSEGLFAFDHATGLDLSATVHGPKGSGSAAVSSEAAAGADAATLAREAVDTALQAQNPQPIEPGDYTVIFEPEAVLDLLAFLVWNLSARDADEGTTAFAGKVGEKLMSEKVTLTTEIDRPELPSATFGEDGLPARKTGWFARGVVERLRYDRYWAKEKATEPDPSLFPLFMEGEDRSTEELVALCERGLLVKRLWYIRYVYRKEFLLTGMTRNGLFLVEKGMITGPVQNLRFNESPIVFLNNVEAMSRPKRVGNWAMMPGVMSREFTFSSTTDSV